MLTHSMSHELLARQRPAILLREAERDRLARLATGRVAAARGRPGILARIRQAVAALRYRPARPSTRGEGEAEAPA